MYRFYAALFLCSVFISGTLHAQSPLIISEFDSSLDVLQQIEFLEIYNFSDTETVDLDERDVYLVIFNSFDLRVVRSPLALSGTVGPGEFFVLGESGIPERDQTFPLISLFLVNNTGGIALIENLDPDELPPFSPAEFLPETATVLDACYFASRVDTASTLPEILDIQGIPADLPFSSVMINYSIQRDISLISDFESARRDWRTAFLETPSPGTNFSRQGFVEVGTIPNILRQTNNLDVQVSSSAAIVTATAEEFQPESFGEFDGLFTIQENNSALGFAVPSDSEQPGPETGDTINSFNGFYQSSPGPHLKDWSIILDTTNTPITGSLVTDPSDLTLADEYRLITIENVEIDTDETVYQSWTSYGLWINSSSVPISLKLSRNSYLTGTAIPESPVTITGILIFENGAMQIYPRNPGDLPIIEPAIDSTIWTVR